MSIRPRIFRIRHPWSGTLCQNSQGRCGNHCKKQETVKTPLVPGQVYKSGSVEPRGSQRVISCRVSGPCHRVASVCRHALRGKSHNHFVLHKSIDELSPTFYCPSMPRSPKKPRRCAGCGDPLSSHKAGQAGADCKGTGQTNSPAAPLTMADLKKRKEELEAAIQEAELRREVESLEKKLQLLQSPSALPPSSGGTGAPVPPAAGPPASGKTAPHDPPALLPPPGPGTTVPPTTGAGQQAAVQLGPGDITLDTLRQDAELLAKVTKKFPELASTERTAEAKPTGKKKPSGMLSPEHFVFSCDSADDKKYDDLSAEEFLSGCMGLLLSPALPAWELRGRLALLQYTCHRLARYRWPVVRAFHHAAVARALRVSTEWNTDWEDIKEYYFDGDASKLKNTTAATTSLQSTTNARPCWSFQKNECKSTACRFDHYCGHCFAQTGQRFRHPDATCRRKKFGDKKTKDDKQTSE
ncbi:hypothetical protein Bbelb_020120 [Branchiostoma belcheri]|nr:hypothetical protein Bbelb_020120 [Branchiostoma belcheri]